MLDNPKKGIENKKTVASLLKRKIKLSNNSNNDNDNIIEYLENNLSLKTSKKNNLKDLYVFYDKDKKRVLEKEAKKLSSTLTNIVRYVLNEYVLALSNTKKNVTNTNIERSNKNIKDKLVFNKNVRNDDSLLNKTIVKKERIYIKYDREKSEIIEKEAERLDTTKSDIVRVLLDKYLKDIKNSK